MSGGSFDYLSDRDGTRDEYARVLNEIHKRGVSSDSAVVKDLLKLIATLEEADRLRVKLQSVIHRTEWACSHDTSMDDIDSACAMYELDGGTLECNLEATISRNYPASRTFMSAVGPITVEEDASVPPGHIVLRVSTKPWVP